MDFLTLDEIAVITRAPLSSVRGWIRHGRLPATRPGRRVLVRRADLDAFLAAAAVRVAGRTP
jgi:excisionase family DNA binding protein